MTKQIKISNLDEIDNYLPKGSIPNMMAKKVLTHTSKYRVVAHPVAKGQKITGNELVYEFIK